jgi:hypothetical protein
MTTSEFIENALWSKYLFKEMEKHVLSELSLFSYNKKNLTFHERIWTLFEPKYILFGLE